MGAGLSTVSGAAGSGVLGARGLGARERAAAAAAAAAAPARGAGDGPGGQAVVPGPGPACVGPAEPPDTPPAVSSRFCPSALLEPGSQRTWAVPPRAPPRRFFQDLTASHELPSPRLTWC